MSDIHYDSGDLPHPRDERAEPSEREWLENMLQRHPDSRDEPGSTSPGWLLAGEEQMSTLEPRAKAYLEAGGTLGREELTELSRYLALLFNMHNMDIEAGAVKGEAEVAAHRARMEEIKAFNRRVREMRHSD